MKTILFRFGILLALGWATDTVGTGVIFEENFNFGALDQNLVATNSATSSFVVSTNADGNGVLRLQDQGSWGSATVTTSFDTLGDFTNTVTANFFWPGVAGDFGIKILAPTGWAGIYYHSGDGNVLGMISFTSLATNGNLVVQSQTPVFQTARVGNTVSLGIVDGETYRPIVSAADPSLAAPVRFQMFFNCLVGASYGGWFDDFVITADQIRPTPIPRLQATIRVAAVEVSWPSYTNRQYQVWYATTLAPTVWAPLGPSTNGTGYTMSLIDWILGQPNQRFYQVIESRH